MDKGIKWIAVMVVGGVSLAFSGLALAQDVSGTSTVEVSTDPGFEGLYKYCLTVNWDITATGVGLSHFTTDLKLGGCDCICEPGFFSFADPAGTGPGEPAPCTVQYQGQFQCDGDPTIPGLAGPALKFEYLDALGCEPGAAGSMVVCFYSPAEPNTSQTYTDALIVKAGVDVIRYGDLVGVLPVCNCAVHEESAVWGSVKTLFK